MSVLYTLTSHNLAVITMEAGLDNYSNVTDTFTESIEIPNNPIQVLANTEIKCWQLIGGGHLSEKKYQKVKVGVSKKITFNMDKHFSVQCLVENTNSSSIYIHHSQLLDNSGRYSVDSVQKVIIFNEGMGGKSTMGLITLNRHRLVLEDSDKFRYYYQAIPYEPA